MSEQKYKIVLLGPPASGKGTQADFLAEKLGLPKISVGQLLREEVDKGSEVGKQASEVMESGGLVPNAIVNEVVKNKIEALGEAGGFVFDGFPRTRIQAKILDTLVKITHVLFVNVADQEVVKRLAGRRTCSKCGKIYHLEFNPPPKENACECGGELELREDDTPEAIHKRLKIYHDETEEVVEYYKEKDLLIEIDGTPAIEEVKQEIFNKLKI